jgi:hypothetical protein
MFDLTVQDFDGEPRMRDLDIADALGFKRTRKIRELIERHLEALEQYGQVVCAKWRKYRSAPRGAPRQVWLNEKQSLFIAAKCETPTATQVLLQMVDVFSAWRHGRLTPPQPERAHHVTPDMMDIKALVNEARLTFGRAAGREMWRRMGMPDLPIEDEVQAKRLTNVTIDGPIVLFLQEECLFTGDPRDWIRSRDLYARYLTFCDEGSDAALGKRAFSMRLRALSDVYRCPSSGGQFMPMKRSDTGYCGLRLIAGDD